VAAAGRVAAETGVAVSVRLDPAAPDGRAMLDRLAAVGCPASQVLFPNADELLGAAGAAELQRLARLAEAGATLEFCFGNVFRLREGFPCQADERRLDVLTTLIGRGLAHRLVLGQSVWMKIQLRRHGGYGYGHLMRTIVPALQARGVGRTQVQQMLVGNPRRLLDRTAGD
jgi:phosphotriesterase-related protein